MWMSSTGTAAIMWMRARPQTLALQINILKTQKPDAPDRIAIGRNLAEAVQSKIQSLRFTAINMDERKQIETRGRQVHKLQSERAKLETPVAPTKKAKGGRDAKQPISVQLPASPVAARPIANAEGARAVPALPVVPKPQTDATEGAARKSREGRQEGRHPATPARAVSHTGAPWSDH